MGDSQIIIFNRDDGGIGINVRVEGDTVWLTQKAMAELFDVNTPAISKHLSNIFGIVKSKYIPQPPIPLSKQ